MKTAECVTPKHPDKMCDRISDGILDYCLSIDPRARVAIETMGGHGIVYVTGEITMTGKPGDIEFSDEINEIIHLVTGGNERTFINIVSQSPEIAGGVDTGGAGDQGIMVGYACNENEAMIPQELFLARSLCKHLYQAFPYDGKTQITIDEYGAILTIVASFQKADGFLLRENIDSWLAFHKFAYHNDLTIYCNPAGDWNIGGFEADTGLTGRKLMVDNYGPQVAIGGGCFSGKDATKVDRSAAYMARKIAVHYLNYLGAKTVMVKLAYAIGVADPVMVSIEVDGKKMQKVYGQDLTPAAIIRALDLRKPQYAKTAEWGHFGNGFAWDVYDRA